jgi:hypothetical protein
MDMLHHATLGQRLQVALRSRHAYSEPLADVGDRHTLALLDEAPHAFPAFDIRERRVESHIAHKRSQKHQGQSDYSIGMSECQGAQNVYNECICGSDERKERNV